MVKVHTRNGPGKSSTGSLQANIEHKLWQEWRNERNDAAREELIFHHLEFAKILAAKAFSRRYNDEFEFAEYMQFATVGLMEAVDRFDPNYSVSFRTFSAPRIQGAILDGLSSLSEQQRQISARQKLVSQRAASVADGMLDEKSQNGDVFEQLASVATGLALGYLLEGTSMYLDDEPVMADNCYAQLELKQIQNQVRALVEALPLRERLVIKYHYLNGLSFETIARISSLSKGRVSQLHRRALGLLLESIRCVRNYDKSW